MFDCGDIITSPWGKGVVLGNCGTAGGVYILWVDFNAHGFGRAPFRLENAYEDEEDAKYYGKVGRIADMRPILDRIRAGTGTGGE